MCQQMSEIMKNAEAKGEEGEVDEAQELFQQAEALQQTKASLEAKALQVTGRKGRGRGREDRTGDRSDRERKSSKTKDCVSML